VLRGKGVAFWGHSSAARAAISEALATLRAGEKGLTVALVVIGGHSRSVGKTSVVAGLIAALARVRVDCGQDYAVRAWDLLGECEPCDCATSDSFLGDPPKSGIVRAIRITSRFLVAGAVQALWTRTEQGRLAEAMPSIASPPGRRAPTVIMESNSVLKFLRPGSISYGASIPQLPISKPPRASFLDRA